MSKKIIYLLSLLMALSLVFASCKKNGGDNITGPGPGDNSVDNSPTTESGLADSSDWLDQNSGDTIKNEPIPNFQSEGGVAYFRNPVIVVLGNAGSDVVVFAEKRYKSPGTDNDIGINGDTATDIVYISSVDAGKKWGTPGIVGRTAQSQGGTDAVADPVVFKVDNSTVVVVASAGAGLSRVDQNYSARGTGSQESQLKYTIGTYNNGNFTWTDWTKGDMTDTVKAAITDNGTPFTTTDGKQFATHSGKGIVSGSGNNAKLYLAVTVSDQGKNGASKEEMGNIMFIGTYNSNNITWKKVDNSAIKFNATSGFSQHKESRVIAATGDTIDQIEYIAVGNPWSSPKNENIGYATAGKQPTDTIAGSEGSPSYLEVANWKGSQSYDPKTYNRNENGTKKRLFAHVKSRINTITMYALGDTGFTSTGKAYTVKAYPEDNTTLAKSSSMDVLGDGTIIMVAEQGNSEKEYFIVYKRFTQKFLAEKLGIN